MKNLMIYIHPSRGFGEEEKKAIKIHIDNSFDLGWYKEDIMLATNFPYDYRGIQAIVLSDDLYCPFQRTTSKANAILKLFEEGLIDKGMYWFHDLDVYQNMPFAEEEINLGDFDMALCDYGRMPLWNSGALFFKKSAWDIFQTMRDYSYNDHECHEQDALNLLTGGSLLENQNELRKRLKLLNVTYNFTSTNLPSNWLREAEKPLKAVHFHLTPPMIDTFLKGQNRVNEVLVSPRLLKIMANYGLV